MKKYFLALIFVLSLLVQTRVFAQTTPTKPVTVSTPVTFASIFNPQVFFKIQVQTSGTSVYLNTSTTGTKNYIISVTVLNQDGLDPTYIPTLKNGLVTSIRQSDLLFTKMTPNTVYRIMIVGKNADNSAAVDENLGEYFVTTNITNPNVIDNAAIVLNTSSAPVPLSPPVVSDMQKNLYTDYNATVTGVPSNAITPSSASAPITGGLVTCGRFQGDTPCGLEELFNLLNRLIKFAIQDIFFPVFIFSVLYLGFSFITAKNSATAWGKAKAMATNMAIGVLMILGAWLIVYTALNVLGASGATTYFK